MKLAKIGVFVLVLVVNVLSLSACTTMPFASKSENKMIEIPTYNNAKQIPEWFLAKEDSNSTDLIATAIGISKDMQFAIDKASLDAKLQLAEKLGTTINSLTQESVVENGFGIKDTNREIDRVSKARVAQKLNFFRREHIAVVKDKDSYRAFVMLKISKEDGHRLTRKEDAGSRESRMKELDFTQ